MNATREEISSLKGVIDAERCFRLDYPYYQNIAPSIVMSSDWFNAYREGFEGISSSNSSRHSRFRSHYERGKEVRKIIFGNN